MPSRCSGCCSAPTSGRLVGALGERWVYLTGLLVVALSSGTAFAGSYWQLLVLRRVSGVGSTMFTVSAASLLVRLAHPLQRARAASAYGVPALRGRPRPGDRRLVERPARPASAVPGTR